MPGYIRRFRNRSIEAAEARERLRQKKLDSWEALKARVAAKYQEGSTA
jgi:hypothetical protein